MSDFDYLCKILLVGGAESGKTSLLIRYTDEVFQPETEVSSSDGEPSFKIKKLTVLKRLVKLQMWDVHPKDRKNITGSYFRGAQGIILVFNLFDQQSFEELKNWHKEIEVDICTTGVKKLMVGHHFDITGEKNTRVISTEEAKALAEKSGYMYSEANSQTGENVQQSFLNLITEIVKSKEDQTSMNEDEELIRDIRDTKTPQSCTCLVS